MSLSRTQEIRVGVITTIAVLATVGIIIWGKGIGFGKDTKLVQISFPDASGIEIGTPITLRGVRRGDVAAIQVRPGDVLVTARVDLSGITLHNDASAAIQMLELTGGKKIEILPGFKDAVLDEKAVIRGETPGDISKLVAGADSLRQQVVSLLHSVDSTVMFANAYLGDKNIRYSINSTLENVQDASAGLRQVVDGNKKQINEMVSSLHELSQDLKQFFDRVSPQAERAIGSIDRVAGSVETVVTDVRSAVRTADTSLRHADVLVSRIDSVVADLRHGQGTLSKLLYDKKFAAELEATLKNVRALVEEVKKYGINTNVSFGKQP